MQLKNPAHLCTPAQLYLGMSLLSTLAFSATSTTFIATAWHLFMNLAWTYFLNFLCDKGHPGISWFLILFPFLIILGIVLVFVHVLSSSKKVPHTTATSAAHNTAKKAGATSA